PSGMHRYVRLSSRYGRHRCFREFLDDRGYLLDVCTAIEKASEARGNEAADELGVVLDEIGMDDDAVAHRRHAAIRIPQDASLFVAARLFTLHVSLCVPGEGGYLSGNQRWGPSGRIDGGDANLARMEPAAFHEGGPLLKLGCPGRYGNDFSLQILRALDIRLL